MTLIDNIKFPLSQKEIEDLLEIKTKLENKIIESQVQRFIFDIENLYLKIQNLGYFTYEILPSPRNNYFMIQPIDIYNSPTLLFNLKMYKNNGKEKDHPDDIRELKNSLKNIVMSNENYQSLNLFKNIKRKERFDVYNKIADMYNIPEFKKVISLLKSEKPIQSVNYDKFKNQDFKVRLKDKEYHFNIPECKGGIGNIEYEMEIDKIHDVYKEAIRELEKKTITKLGFDITCYLKIYEGLAKPLIKCNYIKNENDVIIGRNIDVEGISTDNEFYNEIKKNIDVLQKTSAFDYIYNSLNFNEKNIKQSLYNLFSVSNNPSDLGTLNDFLKFTETYSEIQKEKKKILLTLNDDESVKLTRKRM